MANFENFLKSTISWAHRKPPSRYYHLFTTIFCSYPKLIIHWLIFKDSLGISFTRGLEKLLTISQVNLAACTKQNCTWYVSSNCINIFCVYSDFTNLFLFLNSDSSLFSDKGWQFSKKEFCDVLLRLHI